MGREKVDVFFPRVRQGCLICGSHSTDSTTADLKLTVIFPSSVTLWGNGDHFSSAIAVFRSSSPPVSTQISLQLHVDLGFSSQIRHECVKVSKPASPENHIFVVRTVLRGSFNYAVHMAVSVSCMGSLDRR